MSISRPVNSIKRPDLETAVNLDLAIILTPEAGELAIHLKGDLAGILTLAQNKAKPLARVAKGSGDLAQQVTMVAGKRNILCALFLVRGLPWLR